MPFSKSFLKNPNLKPYMAEFKPTEVVFWEGDHANHFYIILEGVIEIRRQKPDGNPMVLAALRPGEFFGEMSLLNNLARTGTAVAKEKSKVLVLTQEQLLAVIGEDSQFALKMIKMLCERLKNLGDAFVQI